MKKSDDIMNIKIKMLWKFNGVKSKGLRRLKTEIQKDIKMS